MASFSIIDELLGTPHHPTEPGATSLISRLLEVVAHEATENDTNIHTGYAIVKSAREKREKIEQALQALTENDEDEAALQVLTDAVNGIRELEKLVLDVGVLKSATPLDFDSKSVEMALAHLTAWEDLRKRLGDGHRKVIKFVDNAEPTVTPEQRHDDASILQTFVVRIENGDGTSITSPDLAAVRDLLKGHSEAANKESGLESLRVMYAIRAAWLIHSAILEAGHAPEDRKFNLNDDKLWQLGVEFIQDIPTLEEAPLDAKYKVFVEKLLNNNRDAPVFKIIKLIVASRKITRPFLSRNETLLKYCMTLVREYNGDSAKKILQQGSVKLAIDEALKAVQAGGASLPDMTTLDVEPASLKTAEEAYAKAQAQVKDILKKYVPREADALDQAMQTAIQEDKERINMLKGRCESKPAKKTNFQKTGIVIANSPVSPDRREYTNDTKIGALIWEARTKSKKNIVGLKQDGKLVDAHATVQSLDATKPLEFVEQA